MCVGACQSFLKTQTLPVGQSLLLLIPAPSSSPPSPLLAFSTPEKRRTNPPKLFIMDQGISVSAQGHPPDHGASSTSPSAPSTPVEPSRKPPAPKRKRTGDGASDSADSSSQPPRTRDGPKKKKANRACAHCQKAHLTCDDCECSPRIFSSFVFWLRCAVVEGDVCCDVLAGWTCARRASQAPYNRADGSGS